MNFTLIKSCIETENSGTFTPLFRNSSCNKSRMVISVGLETPIPQTLKNTLDTSEHPSSPSQPLSISNWQKNQETYLEPIRILIEGGLGSCAHTRKKLVSTHKQHINTQQNKNTNSLFPHILYSTYGKNQDVNEGTSWQMNGCTSS